jgi:putative endonuclease
VNVAGQAGEDAAALLLTAEGWSILARNFRDRRGEIDIIAARGGILAFVEVKAWEKYGAIDLELAIGRSKRRRIIETSKIFLSRHREYNGWRVRYDVFLFRDGRVAERYESAFTGES